MVTVESGQSDCYGLTAGMSKVEIGLFEQSKVAEVSLLWFDPFSWVDPQK
jgi:hypothetical protein